MQTIVQKYKLTDHTTPEHPILMIYVIWTLLQISNASMHLGIQHLNF